MKSLGPSLFVSVVLILSLCGGASSLVAEAPDNPERVNSDLSANAAAVSYLKHIPKVEHLAETNTNTDDSETTLDNTQVPGISPSVVVTESGDIDFATTRLSRRLDAVRTTSPIKIDGRLDEEAWKDAPIALKPFSYIFLQPANN